MAIVRIEGKEVTLPDEVVKAGEEAIRAVLAANGFPAVEKAAIEIVGAKGNSPAIVKVAPRSTGKGGPLVVPSVLLGFALAVAPFDRAMTEIVGRDHNSRWVTSAGWRKQALVAYLSRNPGAIADFRRRASFPAILSPELRRKYQAALDVFCERAGRSGE